MKNIWIALILVSLSTACTASPTDTPLPPTETSISATPTPNPHAEEAFTQFCESADEGDVAKAQGLFTEDIRIVMTGETTHEGLNGVKEFLDIYTEMDMGDCQVKKFDVKGDHVSLTWTHSFIAHEPPEPEMTIKAICKINGTMQGEKIAKATYNCDFVVTETPTPNPYAEEAILALCKYADEGDVESAQGLFTEDVQISLSGKGDSDYEGEHAGLSGVAEYINDHIKVEASNCRVKRIEVYGDEVTFLWAYRFPYGSYTIKAYCDGEGTMQGDKVHKFVLVCDFEMWEY